MRRLAVAVVMGMLTLPASAWLLAWLGVGSFDAAATPPAWEQALARIAVGGLVDPHAPPTPHPLPPSADVPVAGAKGYPDASPGGQGGPLGRELVVPAGRRRRSAHHPPGAALARRQFLDGNRRRHRR